MTATKTSNKILLMFLALVIAFGIGIPISALTADQVHAAKTKKNVQFSHYTKYNHAIFKCMGMQGVCVNPGVTPKSGKAEQATQKSNNSEEARIAYYYGVKKKWFKNAPSNNSKNVGRMHNMLSIATVGEKTFREKSLKYDRASYVDSIIKDAKELISAIPKNLDIPDSFEFWYVKTGDASKGYGGGQNFVVWQYEPPVPTTLKKSSSDSLTDSLKAYTKKGIEYKVYREKEQKAANEVGTLTCNKDGSTNKLNELKADETYYVKETKTNKYFIKNKEWESKKVKKNSENIIKVKDDPVKVPVPFVKEIQGGEPSDEEFKLELTSTENTNVKFDVSVKGDGTPSAVKVYASTYKVKEVMTDEQMEHFTGLTGVQTITVDISDTGEPIITLNDEQVDKITFINAPVNEGISVKKETTDGSPTKDFTFKITGELYNEGTLKAGTAVTYADLNADVEADIEKGYTVTDWTANEDDISVINEAAKQRKTGAYTIHITGTATSSKKEESPEEYPDVPLTAEISVDLQPVEYDQETESYKPELTAGETSAVGEGVTGKNLTWKGSATMYKDLLNGKDYSLMITDESGTGLWNGDAEKTEIRPAFKGKYTAEELLTEKQAKLYKQPQPQTKELNEKGEATIFHFTNEPKVTPVKLKKTCEDGNVEDIEFRLTGTDLRGEKIDLVNKTDKDGNIDFGELYGGEYIIEETGFDSTKYVNKYPMEGYDNPAQKITVTGEEEEPIEVEFENPLIKKLYITKVDKETQEFLEDAEFELTEEDGTLAARFVIITGDNGEPEIKILESNGEITASKVKEVVEDEDTVVVDPDDEDGDEEPIDDDEDGDEYVDDDEDGDEYVDDDEDGDEYVDDDEDGDEYIDDDEDGDEYIDDDEDGDDEDGDEYIDDDEDGDEEDGDDEEDVDDDEYDYAVLQGLREGVTYILRETKSPSGYSSYVTEQFLFENNMKLVVENEQPEIGTTATDKDTGLHQINPHKAVTIVDTVSYKNLTAGREYEMHGTLMYRPSDLYAQAQPVIIDGKPVSQIKKFIAADGGSGTVDLEFTLNAESLAGKTTVVYETLLDRALPEDEQELTEHADPEDEGQTIDFLDVHTNATADDTKDHITNADDTVTITDVVTYTNLVKGKEYTMKGTLMNKKTGQPIMVDGEPVTAEKTFVADGTEVNGFDDNENDIEDENGDDEEGDEDGDEEEGDDEGDEPKFHQTRVSGTVALTFEFDGSKLAGTTTVVFEELMLEGKLVGEHKDLDDDEQTVEIPEIGTKASRSSKNTIEDKVAYKNLIPGKTYIMRGVIVEKSSEEEVTDEVEKEFTPKESYGVMTLKFDIDAESLAGEDVVAFEECYIIPEDEEAEDEEVLVAEHKNINDKNQTVHFDRPPNNPPNPPRTGDDFNIWIIIAIMLATAGTATGTIIYRRRHS